MNDFISIFGVIKSKVVYCTNILGERVEFIVREVLQRIPEG